jgi:hypothetical protein
MSKEMREHIDRFKDFMLKESREERMVIKNAKDELYFWFMNKFPEINISDITIAGDAFQRPDLSILTDPWTVVPGIFCRVQFTVEMNGERYYRLTIDFDKYMNIIENEKSSQESYMYLWKNSNEIKNILMKHIKS